MSVDKLKKGENAEECLKRYFLDTGAFAIRSVEIEEGGETLTDIDLWLYTKSSAFRRERVNVDSKNKKTPKVAERIFWTKGIQSSFGFDSCIVATTDNRENLKELERKFDIQIINGTFLRALMDKYSSYGDRLSEEEITNLPKDNKLVKKWSEINSNAKKALVTGCSFNSCNMLLHEVGYFLNQAVVDKIEPQVSIRYFYLLTSYLLINLDFILSREFFSMPKEKEECLRGGFCFGEEGVDGFERLINQSFDISKLVLGSKVGTFNSYNTIVRKSVEGTDFEVLVSFFVKNEVVKELYHNAIKLEHLAFSRSFENPDSLDVNLKGILSVLVDFYKIERKRFFITF